jgi:hypothetical protein
MRTLLLVVVVALVAASCTNPTAPYTAGASCILVNTAPWQAPGQAAAGHPIELCSAPSGELTVGYIDWKGH